MIQPLPFLAILLVGCAAAIVHPQPVAKSQVFDRERLEQLLRPCTIAGAREFSANEAVRVANVRFDELVKCNADKAEALRIVQGQ